MRCITRFCLAYLFAGAIHAQERANAIITIVSGIVQLKQPVSIRATITPLAPAVHSPAGTVDFTVAGCASVPVENSVAICNTSFPQLGPVTVNVTYSGDAKTKPSFAAVSFNVGKVSAGIYTAFAPDPAEFGRPVTVNVLLLGALQVANPSGTVTFRDNGVELANAPVGSDGRAGLSMPFNAGNHSVAATYNGDANYQIATASALAFTVAKAATIVTLSAGTAQVNQPVHLRAAVAFANLGTGVAGGTMAFTSSAAAIPGCAAVAPSGNVATCTTAFPLGSYSIGAAYTGDANTIAGSSTMQLTVGKAVPGIFPGSFPESPVFGAPITISAQLLGAGGVATPTGTVTFSDGATRLAVVPPGADGRAALVAALSTGVHSIVASYSGDANYLAATAPPFEIAVARAATIVALASPPAQLGQPFALKAAVTVQSPGSANPAGSLDFSHGGKPIAGCTAIPVRNGIASCNTSFPQLGNYIIQAAYTGDTNTAPSAATLQLTVAKAVPGIYSAFALAAPVFGAPVTISALVTGAAGLPAPTGSVTFTNQAGMRVSTSVDIDGRAGFARPLDAGTHTFLAVYDGDANYAAAAAAPLNLVIGKAVTSTVVTAKFGEPLEATVMVTPPGAGTPGGTVQFFQNGTSVGTAALVQQGATFIASLAAAPYSGTVYAVYQGDANFSASTSPPVNVAARVDISIASDQNPAVAGASVRFTVRVTAASPLAPTGAVRLSTPSEDLGTAALAGGAATFVATLGIGSHTVTAGYSGDSLYPASAATFTQVVSRTVTSLSLTADLATTVYGQPVRFSARLPVPSGTVQFSNGPAAIGTAQASAGIATLAVASLGAGTHSITALWPGDNESSSAVSPPLAHTVMKAATRTALSASGTMLQAAVQPVPPGAGIPTGTVRFLDAENAVFAAAELAEGIATVPMPSPGATVAVYAGDRNFQPGISAALASVTAVNSATFTAGPVAPDSIVSLFGSNLATPVTVTDSTGRDRDAKILFASPGQINFLMPADVAPGLAVVAGAAVEIAAVAPGLFTREGAPVAHIVRVRPDGTQEIGQFAASIDLGPPTDIVYLVLYGTGFRRHATPPICTIAGQPVTVTFAGAQPAFPGLDQINLVLPQSLRASGTVQLHPIFDGVPANPVTLRFQ